MRNLSYILLSLILSFALSCGDDDSPVDPNNGNNTPEENVPLTPSGLQAETVSSNSINLSWKDNSDNETGFQVERKTTDDIDWSQIGQAAKDSTTFKDDSLKSNTTYFYRVNAFNAKGNSTYSNETSATTSNEPLKPPVNLTALLISSSEIQLTWIDNSDNEDGFKIERKDMSASQPEWEQITQVGADETSYKDLRLPSSTTYYYRICAFNSAGKSGYSNEAFATTPVNRPLLPSGLVASFVSSSEIHLSWCDNSNDEEGFKIERKTGSAGNWEQAAVVEASTEEYSDEGLASNTTFFYRVLAYNEAGTSDYSNISAATTATDIPDAPSNLHAETRSAREIYLEWIDNSNNEDGFEIERKTDIGGEYDSIEFTLPDVMEYSDTRLSPNTTYYYRIRAVNGVGNSDFSDEASATTDDAPDVEYDTLQYEDGELIYVWTLPNRWGDKYHNVRFTPTFAPFYLIEVHISLFEITGSPDMRVIIWESSEQDGEPGYPGDPVDSLDIPFNQLVQWGPDDDPNWNVIDLTQFEGGVISDDSDFHIGVDVIQHVDEDTLAVLTDDGKSNNTDRSIVWSELDEAWMKMIELNVEGHYRPYNFGIRAVISDTDPTIPTSLERPAYTRRIEVLRPVGWSSLPGYFGKPASRDHDERGVRTLRSVRRVNH